jgi:Alpha-L-arabinofuranosidase
MIADSLRKYHPEIKIIGTSGTAASGSNYDGLWQFSRDQKLVAVDEHYYVSPTWLLENQHRYDNFDRKGPKVFVGEWASGDDRLINAVTEAAYLTNVERNGDVIDFTCYAPLLVNDSRGGWRPDLIRFDRTRIAKTPNYYVQQLFSTHSGQKYINSTLTYTDAYKPDPLYPGQIGVGTWNTQAKFKDIKVVSGDSVVINENFASGSSNWTVNDGTFAVSNGVYTQTASSTPAWSIFKTPVTLAEYTYTLKAMKTGGVEGFVIPFAYGDKQNYCWLNIGGWWNNQHAVEKSVAGGKSTIVTAAGSIQNNVWYDIKIDVTKSGAKFYLNSTLLFELAAPDGPVSASVVKDTINNKLIVKMVNAKAIEMSAKMSLKGVVSNGTVETILLTGSATTLQNTLDAPALVAPVKGSYTLTGDSLQCTLPAYSMQVFTFDIDNSTSGVSYVEAGKYGKSGLKIVPNPMLNSAQVYFENGASESFTLSLVDVTGKLVLKRSDIKDNHVEINKGQLKPGIYFVNVKSATSGYSDKLIVK